MSDRNNIASCVVLVNDDGRILGVSRKDDHDDWNLPGGGNEPGETPEDTAIREVKEETGLDIHNLTLIKESFRDNGVVSYYCADYSGEISSSEKGAIKWLTWNDLLDPGNSFYEFNQQLFDHLYSQD